MRGTDRLRHDQQYDQQGFERQSSGVRRSRMYIARLYACHFGARRARWCRANPHSSFEKGRLAGRDILEALGSIGSQLVDQSPEDAVGLLKELVWGVELGDVALI